MPAKITMHAMMQPVRPLPAWHPTSTSCPSRTRSNASTIRWVASPCPPAAEIGPLDERGRPRRPPAVVRVQPEVRHDVVGSPFEAAGTDDPAAVRQRERRGAVRTVHGHGVPPSSFLRQRRSLTHVGTSVADLVPSVTGITVAHSVAIRSQVGPDAWPAYSIPEAVSYIASHDSDSNIRSCQ